MYNLFFYVQPHLQTELEKLNCWPIDFYIDLRIDIRTHFSFKSGFLLLRKNILDYVLFIDVCKLKFLPKNFKRV